MSKSKKKCKNSYNSTIINELAKKYDFSSRYIRQILDDDRTPTFADKIKAEYKAMVNAITKIIKSNEI